MYISSKKGNFLKYVIIAIVDIFPIVVSVLLFLYTDLDLMGAGGELIIGLCASIIPIALSCLYVSYFAYGVAIEIKDGVLRAIVDRKGNYLKATSRDFEKDDENFMVKIKDIESWEIRELTPDEEKRLATKDKFKKYWVIKPKYGKTKLIPIGAFTDKQMQQIFDYLKNYDEKVS